MKKCTTLDQISVASPCQVPWESMQGDDRVRFCGQCQLHVYNLVEMTREEATELVERREGRTCVRFFRRSDGTVLTRDCPMGLRMVRRQVARGLAATAALLGLLVAAPVWAWARRGPISCGPNARGGSPLQRIIEWIDPQQGMPIAGGICAPPPVIVPTLSPASPPQPTP
jgi:hypothetical protein